jgi:hypothetical protein
MTIAIHLSGSFSLLTATDTQGTYTSGEKVDSGKIMGAWRANPLGAINVAGAGNDSHYMKALSQEIVQDFKNVTGTVDQLEKKLRETAGAFYKDHVFPFVGKLEDANVPDYSLLVATRHEATSKLWNIEGTVFTESSLFDCIGIGSPVAEMLLNKLYPLYPTLDSLAVLAAYVIYRVKSSVDGCGLNTEIRFIHADRPGMVPFELIEKWEALFRKYERLESEVFYHAMNFVANLQIPKLPEHLANVPALTSPQMKALPEIVKEIEEMRAEFAHSTIFKPSI